MTRIARRSRAVRPDLAARLPLPLWAAALCLLAAGPARALTLDFDALPDLSDAAAASLPGVALSPAQVLSEGSVALLLGYEPAGTWASSPDQGILNSLGPVITFSFTAPVASFAIDVLGLPSDGVTLPIALLAYAGDALVASAVSDPLVIGDSGLHEQRLALAGGAFTSIRLGALVGCGAGACLADLSSTVFADSATFAPVPEPGTLALVGLGLAALAGGTRR